MIHSIKRSLEARYLFNETIEVPVNHQIADPYGGSVQNEPEDYNNNNPYGIVDFRGNYNLSGYKGTILFQPQTTTPPSNTVRQSTLTEREVYDAPFFTAWILTIATLLFYPVHQMTVRFCSCMGRKGPKTMSRAISDAVQGFRERGMSLCK